MKLRVHDTGKQIMLQRWNTQFRRWKNVAGPYKDAKNAQIGVKHYKKYRGEDFKTRVGRQIMALKDWGDVKL